MSLGVVKNSPNKRTLEDSCLDDSYETPTKKPSTQSATSPDVGLGWDSFNVDTPQTVSQHLPLEQQKAIRRQTEVVVADEKFHLNASSSSESCVLSKSSQSDRSPPNGVLSGTKSSQWSPVNHANAFDFGINSILCLSPLACKAEGAGNVYRCLCLGSSSPLTHHPTARRPVEGGVVKAELSAAWKREGNGASDGAEAVVEGDGGRLSHDSLELPRAPSGSSRPLLKSLPLQRVGAASPEENGDLRDAPSDGGAPPSPGAAASEPAVDQDIGAPMFESTICDSPRAAHGPGEHTVQQSSFEDGLPLDVQVKPMVVENSQDFKGISPVLPLKQRPLCMDSVARQEYSGPDTAVTELLTLMNVTEQQQGDQWQHPSDLTMRNYQKQFGNLTPRMSLAEWKAQNSKNHQGFSTVPKMFQRRPDMQE